MFSLTKLPLVKPPIFLYTTSSMIHFSPQSDSTWTWCDCYKHTHLIPESWTGARIFSQPIWAHTGGGPMDIIYSSIAADAGRAIWLSIVQACIKSRARTAPLPKWPAAVEKTVAKKSTWRTSGLILVRGERRRGAQFGLIRHRAQYNISVRGQRR